MNDTKDEMFVVASAVQQHSIQALLAGHFDSSGGVISCKNAISRCA
jgi:hypothetical protein